MAVTVNNMQNSGTIFDHVNSERSEAMSEKTQEEIEEDYEWARYVARYFGMPFVEDMKEKEAER